MTFYQFLCILRARWMLAVSILAATLMLAMVWIVLRPSYFTARAPVLVDVRTNELGQGYAPGLLASYMATQIDIVKSERVAERVLEMLATNPPKAILKSRDEPAPPGANARTRDIMEIQAGLDVKPARESNIINISWTGASAAESARVANAFAQAFVDTNLELKTQPAKRYAAWFEEQTKASREALEAAQNKLSQFQQKAGIVGSDEQIDYETARLNEISTQLTTVQGETTGSQSKLGVGRDTVAEVIQSPLINGLKTDISKLEGKLQESAATLGARHPTMQRLEAELAALRSRLNQETARINSSISTAYEAGKNRERELQQALGAQKARVMEVTRQRSQLALLRRDVESAQRAFEEVSKSSSASRLQSLANQTNLLPLTAAVEPLEPVGPSTRQALAVAGVAGILLALAGALLLELMNRRVRSIDDIVMATQLPVLASLPASTPAFSARLALASRRRLALGTSGSPA